MKDTCKCNLQVASAIGIATATTTLCDRSNMGANNANNKFAGGRAFMRQLHVSLSGTFRDCMQTTSAKNK